MATPSPFSLLEGFLQKLPSPPNLQPPQWAADEVMRRVVSLLNHILLQEKEATNRLARQKGRIVLLQWRLFAMKLVATPVGLLDLAAAEVKPDLVLALTEDSVMALAQAALRGDKPPVRIEGDVQLAAEVNWLVDHVRWDMEEDLSRLVGDVAAHTIGQATRNMVTALREFLGKGEASADKAPP